MFICSPLKQHCIALHYVLKLQRFYHKTKHLNIIWYYQQILSDIYVYI